MTVPFESAQWSLAAAIATANKVRLTSDRATDVLNVKDFGAVGDSSTDDRAAIQACFDAAYGPASSPHGGLAPNVYKNKAVYFPPGQYMLNSGTLTLTQVNGAHLFGAARGTSVITLNTGVSTDACVRTDCCSYSRFDNLSFNVASANAGTAFDLDMVTTGTTVNLQSNTFIDCNFSGGDYCVRVNKSNVSGSQGSENSWINCYLNGRPAANGPCIGLNVVGQNCVMNTFYGGNIASCDKGIYCQGGSVTTIHGVSFQNQSGGRTGSYDVYVVSGNPDDFSICGCRSETQNFLWIQGGLIGVHVGGCWQWATGGVSIACDGALSVDGCHLGGQFYLNGSLALRSTIFQSSNPFTGAAGNFSGNVVQWNAAPPGQTQARMPWAVSQLFSIPSQCKGLRLYVVDASVSASTSTNFGTVVAPSSTIASGFTGAINDGGTNPGTNLTVSSGTGIAVGQILRGTGVIPGTTIVSGSGTAWQVDILQLVPSGTAMTTGATNIVPVFCDGTNWRIG